MSSLPETLRLCGEGVVLRDWRDADAPTLEPVCGEWDVCRFTSVPWTYSHTEALAWIGRQREKRARGVVLSLAIVEEDADEALGMVNLAGLTDDRRDAELGYWLVPTARGRGLASRAASVLTGWGFETLGLERVEMAILPGNLASHRVAERLGARPEGLRRASHEAGGRRWDMAIYSLTPPD
jgi:ribosomal-protein-alanine N-acetyltransferase